MESRGSRHFTASDIYDHFIAHGTPIGKATIYRQLDELTACGRIKKYIIDESTSACYEFVTDNDNCPDSYHMKCEKCGRLFHLECDEITVMEKHIAEHHDFRLDPQRIVLFGVCKDCYEPPAKQPFS